MHPLFVLVLYCIASFIKFHTVCTSENHTNGLSLISFGFRGYCFGVFPVFFIYMIARLSSRVGRVMVLTSSIVAFSMLRALLDSLKKRLNFLESVIDELKLTNCTTLHGRAEDLSHQDYRESFDIATSRAVARLPILLEWTVPYVKEGGYVVALKGAIYEEEVKESNKALSTLKATIEEVRTVTLPTLDDKRAILYIKKTGKTPKQYPRKPKEIKDKPLV